MKKKITFKYSALVINFIRYTAVGTLGLVLDMTALYSLVEFAYVPVMVATPMAFMVAVINNFLFHKYWTFRDKSRYFKRQFASFFTISVLDLGLTVMFMYVFYDLLNIWYMFAKFITAILVLIFSYTANRIFTFKNIDISLKKS